MAISKKHKKELVDQYVEWMNRSQAIFLSEYIGLNMKQMDELRAKCREVGGEFHIVKNTLGKVAFDSLDLTYSEEFLEGSTAIAFAFQDVPGMAKVLGEFEKSTDFIKVKGGFLDQRQISAQDVKALAELPPLPVIQSQLLGVLLAPASKLVRTLAEPARQMAAVLKAYSEKDASTASA